MATNSSVLRAFLLCGATIFTDNAAIAQPAQSEFEQLFVSQLRNPGDIPTTFRFAEVASQRGEIEAAIGALERILYFNPNLPRVKLELGILYFRLGSFGQARAYLVDALSAPDVPADVRSRVDTFLAEIERRDSPSQFTGFFQTGFRYQTNANAGPISQNVRAFGFEASLNSNFLPRPDWNFFALGAARHVWDLQTGQGDSIETTLQFYSSRQFTFTNLNLGLVEATIGPRLSFLAEFYPGLSVRPYLLGNHFQLGDTNYLTTGGLGVSMFIPLGLPSVEIGVETRRRAYRNDPIDFPTASEQTGVLWTAYASGSMPINDTMRIVARGFYAQNNAASNPYSYIQYVGDVSFQMDFVPFPDWQRQRWTFSPFVGFSRTGYDSPNAIVDPLITRVDEEFRVGASLEVPVYERLGFGTQVAWSKINSTLPNYRTQNFSVMFGPTLRF